MNYTPQMEDSHTCPGRCGRDVSRHLLACRECWRRLPDQYQTPFLTSRWASDWPAHSRAISDALHWYAIDADSRTAAAIRGMP